MKILPLTPCILATPIPIPEVAAQHIRAACNRAWPEKPPMREYCEHDGRRLGWRFGALALRSTHSLTFLITMCRRANVHQGRSSRVTTMLGTLATNKRMLERRQVQGRSPSRTSAIDDASLAPHEGRSRDRTRNWLCSNPMSA